MRLFIRIICFGFALFPSVLSAAQPTVNGFAVSVAWRNGYSVPDQNGYNGDSYCGSVVRFDIAGGTVVRCDTIHNRKNGLAVYPSISPDGSMVAFIRRGMAVNGTVASGQNDPSYIAVVNKDGTNLRNLARLPAAFSGEPICDWPMGDWVYYKKGSIEILRVNVKDTSLNFLVNRYSGWVQNPDTGIRRWSLSLDGKYSLGQMCCNGYGNQNPFHLFPPPGGFIGNSMPIDGALFGCNGNISASGMYGGHYDGGYHQTFLVEIWDHSGTVRSGPSFTMADMAEWLGRDRNNFTNNLGLGAELIRWASNSDKWVMQHIGWHGHAGSIGAGSNQVMANWVDKQAIEPSNNPNIPSGSAVCYGNCSGDFWVDGGADKIQNS